MTMSATDITTETQRLYTEGQSIGQALQAASSDADLQSVAVRAVVLREDCQTVLTSLNAFDVWAASIPSASDHIDALLWERDTRHELVTIQTASLRITEAVGDLLTGEPRERLHTVRSGETWQSIAADLLGDWQRWYDIVEANGLDPADALTAGTVLRIPDGG